jgi:hypothetical protein
MAPFPAIQFLLDLKPTDQSTAHTPLWVLLFRIFIAALAIIALADPILNAGQITQSKKPILIVLDDSWAAASRWEKRLDAVEKILAHADQNGQSAAIIGTTPTPSSETAFNFGTAKSARDLVRKWEPKAWSSSLPLVLAAIESAEIEDQIETHWFSSGVATVDDDTLSAALQKIGSLIVYRDVDNETALLLSGAEGGVALRNSVERPDQTEERQGHVLYRSVEGQILARKAFSFSPGQRLATVSPDLPPELRQKLARVEIEGEASAGAVALLDRSAKRYRVGIVSPPGEDARQPLLSETHYVSRALAPYADLTIDELAPLIESGAAILIVSDTGQIVGDNGDQVAAWVSSGGVLIRFAGPRLAARSDDLTPVAIRRGGRALGGAMSWAAPQKLGSFDERSPFAGLTNSDEITVARQVLAEPSLGLAEKTWARLADGTPLVTAEQRNKGWIVLFHVTADSSWSNLPLSGLFVEMLRRLTMLADNDYVRTDKSPPGDDAGVFSPIITLDGFGRLLAPAPTTSAIRIPLLESFAFGPKNPPGIYGAGNRQTVINISDRLSAPMSPIALDGVELRSYETNPFVSFMAPLLAIVVILIGIDAMAAAYLAGALGATAKRLRGTAALGIATSMLLLTGLMTNAVSADETDDTAGDVALDATLATHLAYVVTGDEDADRMSAAGLGGLSRALRQRTAVEPGDPIGVNVEADELAFFALIYWPMTTAQRKLSPFALSKVDAYLKNGGTILFDTRDQQQSFSWSNDRSATATLNQVRLQRLLSGLDIPALEPVPDDHVLTKAFYLLQSFPGRWSGGQVWVEAAVKTSGGESASVSHDGVSSIIIGSNDWAAAWARDQYGRTMAPVVPGGARQREIAMRFGVNLVMYALTGNYKEDSVHVPALLERLGQ